MGTKPTEPIKEIKVIVAHDMLHDGPDYTFAHLIADGLHGRSNIEIKTLTCNLPGYEGPTRDLRIYSKLRIFT